MLGRAFILGVSVIVAVIDHGQRPWLEPGPLRGPHKPPCSVRGADLSEKALSRCRTDQTSAPPQRQPEASCCPQAADSSPRLDRAFPVGAPSDPTRSVQDLGRYLSHEKEGGLGDTEEREEIVAFFREFTPYVHCLAPDKPVMLAPNCYHLSGAEETYRRLLPNLDIVCPFGYHRMPAGDLRGEVAAALMQALCDEAGCHLWMDVESFVLPDGRLLPRPIDGLIGGLTRFPSFEKILHYQFSGLMSGPAMSRQPGGPASATLYEDYREYLEALRQGRQPRQFAHAAKGKPVTLAQPADDRYPGLAAAGLVDGLGGSPDYRDPQWLFVDEIVVNPGAGR